MFHLYWYYTMILENTFRTHFVAATVAEEDIRCCSVLQVDGTEEGEEPFHHSPPQSTTDKPADTDARHAEVASHGLCSTLGSTPDIAVPDDQHNVTGRKTNE